MSHIGHHANVRALPRRIDIHAEFLRLGHERARDRAHKGLVELGLDGLGTGIGHLRGDGVFLLVHVIREFGLLEIAREHARELLAEVVRNHDGGVVITAPHALLGLLRIREDPAQVVVLLEFVDRLLAGVEFAREFGLHARILVGDCDLDALGATVGVPVRLDVVPGVQGRNDAHTDGDDHRHWIVQQAEHIALEDLPCFSHACLIL